MAKVAAVALMAAGWTQTPIRYSHYNPALGGTNCSSFRDGVCVSRMASGEPWQQWVGQAAACPPSWPFGTVVKLNGREWVCLDRGGAVRYVEGIPFVDFLTPDPEYGYNEIVEAKVAFPDDGALLKMENQQSRLNQPQNATPAEEPENPEKCLTKWHICGIIFPVQENELGGRYDQTIRFRDLGDSGTVRHQDTGVHRWPHAPLWPGVPN